MPLIMITGYPSAGKTTRAVDLKAKVEAKIAADLAFKDYSVVLINDESLSIPKENYRNTQTEKMLRGTQISAVKRHLDRTTIVILDNMTYIKGFRYQLYCEAKSAFTNSCVIHVGAPKDVCREWNSRRGEDAWAQDLFDALLFRYEEPNGMSRWDSPLFTVPYVDKELPINEIWETLVLQKPKPPNRATVLKAAPPGNYLTELDRITMKVVNAVLELHKISPGGIVKLLDYPDKVELPVKLTLPQLNRIRRNFVTLNKMKTIEISRIEGRFIEFLIKNWNID
ncbi:protein Kti12p [Trichomonascus vanleenenianus]|uniref:Kti12p n=1 Tax=Trichomonascus vanleenenianus TaxID=2268995 RepID=UPI003ECB888C